MPLAPSICGSLSPPSVTFYRMEGRANGSLAPSSLLFLLRSAPPSGLSSAGTIFSPGEQTEAEVQGDCVPSEGMVGLEAPKKRSCCSLFPRGRGFGVQASPPSSGRCGHRGTTTGERGHMAGASEFLPSSSGPGRPGGEWREVRDTSQEQHCPPASVSLRFLIL